MIVVLSQTLELPDDTPDEYLKVLADSAARHVGTIIQEDLEPRVVAESAPVRLVSAGHLKHPMSHLSNYETGQRL